MSLTWYLRVIQCYLSRDYIVECGVMHDGILDTIVRAVAGCGKHMMMWITHLFTMWLVLMLVYIGIRGCDEYQIRSGGLVGTIKCSSAIYLL